MTGRRRRSLSEDEHALWRKVTDGVAPLERPRRGKVASPPSESAEIPPAPAAAAETATPPPPPAPRRKSAAPPPKPKPPAPPPLTPLAPIEPRTRRRIARGTVPIEDRIDLHGLTQHDAHGALRGFITASRMRGLKLVLVITGKGRRPSDDAPGHDIFHPGERGVLRRLVPQWLGLADMREHVVGFEEAHLTHGGSGAIYVRLRAARRLVRASDPSRDKS